MNQYDDKAFFNTYAQMPRSQHGLDAAGEWRQLKELFPDLSGKNVLDLGCGYGWHCKYAQEYGASKVIGIDRSQMMIDVARQKNSGECIEYRIAGLTEYDYPAQCFDFVFSNLVLHYVEDLAGVYRNIFRTLRPNGVFLFNIEHPTFTAGVHQEFSADGTWPVTDYFYPGLRETSFLGHHIQKYHHTLSQILNGLIQSGFQIDAVEEAMPPEEWRDAMPEEMRRPMMLLVRARKL